MEGAAYLGKPALGVAGVTGALGIWGGRRRAESWSKQEVKRGLPTAGKETDEASSAADRPEHSGTW